MTWEMAIAKYSFVEKKRHFSKQNPLYDKIGKANNNTAEQPMNRTLGNPDRPPVIGGPGW
jgi:hypothetical protein